MVKLSPTGIEPVPSHSWALSLTNRATGAFDCNQREKMRWCTLQPWTGAHLIYRSINTPLHRFFIFISFFLF
jgi:hypothetical protein